VCDVPLLLHVQIVNETDWWLPYVPPLVGLLGSIIVATAAFFGVSKSNRTNQQAIVATDKREWQKWRRETLLKLSRTVGAVDRTPDRASTSWCADGQAFIGGTASGVPLMSPG
jgi:hypothetical protein